MRPIHRRNITDKVIDRIVTIALRYPQRGPRRLALMLQRDRISVTNSSINSILHQNYLRSFEQRIERVKKLSVTEALTRSDESIKTANTDQTSETPLTEKPKVVWLKPHKWWQQTLFSPLLWGKWMVRLALVMVAVYTGFYAAQLRVKSPNDIKEIAPYSPARDNNRLSTTDDHHLPRPANIVYPDHPVTGKARLENIDEKKVSAQSRKRLIADAGLKLIGTLVADTPEKSVAVIEYTRTRSQETFKEGDRIGNFRVKLILRDRIFIESGQREQKLALMRSLPAGDLRGAGQNTIAIAQAAVGSDRSSITKHARGRARFHHLDRQAVEVSLADVDHVLQHVEIQPATSYGNPAGIRIAPIEVGSIFADLGLRSTDVIVGVNNESISTPDQAALLLQRLKAGGEVTIKVKGKRRNRIIQLDIS